MTLHSIRGGGQTPATPMPARASARIRLDIVTRTVRAELACNRVTLEAIRDGIQAVLEGRNPGYFLSIGSALEPGSVVLTIVPADLGPEAARVPEDYVASETGVIPPSDPA